MGKPVKQTSKEILFAFSSLFCLVVVVAITSFANAGLDLERMLSKESIADAILNAVITLYGTISSLPAGLVATKQRVNADGSAGRYLEEFNEYHEIRKRIEPRRPAFSQWHTAQHRSELHQKRVEYLLARGIQQADDILKLSISEISELTTSQKYTVDGEVMYFKALSPEQIAACKYVASGGVKLHKLPDFYFLSVDGKSSKTFYDQAYYESRDENTTLFVKLSYKIFVGFVITTIFTSLMLEAGSDVTTSEFIVRALILVVARVFNAVTSCLWGWLIGQELAYKQCYYINGRTQFLKLFENDRTFVAKDMQDLAREDYENQILLVKEDLDYD